MADMVEGASDARELRLVTEEFNGLLECLHVPGGQFHPDHESLVLREPHPLQRSQDTVFVNDRHRLCHGTFEDTTSR